MSLGVRAASAPAVAHLRALAHPIRLRILSLLTGTAMSAAEIARELDLTHANASYHLRQLAAADLVHLDAERAKRGGQERCYRYDPSRRLPSPDPASRALFMQAIAQELVRRAEYALPHGTTTDAELWVDPDTWTDVLARVRSAMADLHAAAKPHRTQGAEHVSATVALFRMSS